VEKKRERSDVMNKNKIPFKRFLKQVGYYLSHPYPIWEPNEPNNRDAPQLRYIDSQKEFTIYTAEQLAEFRNLVNKGYSFEGKIVKLVKDIVLNDIANMENWEEAQPINEWTPIGTENHPFKGTFDGGGHVISGVYINKPHNDNQGLFGCVEMEKIRNLWVIAFITGRASIGGLAGQRRQNFGHIGNSYSTIILKGHTDIGGLVGINRGNSKIFHSRATGVVKAPGIPRRGELIGKPNVSEEPLCCYKCSNGIIVYQPNTATCIEISDFEKKLFRQLRDRINKSPYRQSKKWSRYWGRIDVRVKGNCIVIDDLLRNADVKIYDKHSQRIIYSGNSSTLKIPVPAGTYVIEVNKEKHPYPIPVPAGIYTIEVNRKKHPYPKEVK
jgi:hypothetical protein